MSQEQKHVIVSHADDLDGVASAILLTHYIEETYGQRPGVVFTHYEGVEEAVSEATKSATHLWVSDLSIRNIELVDTLKAYTPDTLHFFDHHADTQSFVDAISGFATVWFDCSGNKCAADLIWDFWLSKIPEDESIGSTLELLKDATHSRDLWFNDVQEGIDLSAVIAMLGPDKTYKHLMENIHRVRRADFSDLMEFCVQVAEDTMNKAKSVARATVVNTFYRPDTPKSCAAGLTVVAAVTTGCQSDVGDMFLKEKPLCIVGLINLEKLALSFRTTPTVIQKLGFGVNEIANNIEGGGGHPYAAGAPLTTEMLLSGPKSLLTFMTKIIDAKAFEKEQIKTR